MFIPASGPGEGMGDVSSWSSGDRSVNSHYWHGHEDLMRDAIVSGLIRNADVDGKLYTKDSKNSTAPANSTTHNSEDHKEHKADDK
jgi:hypothetical protein